MLRTVFVIFILYLLYKLVFDFIVPVSKATSTVRSKIKDVQQMQEEQLRAQQAASKAKTTVKPGTTTTDGEYIDFEEVK